MAKIFIEFEVKDAFTENELLSVLSLCQELLSPPKKASITQAKGVKELSVNSYLDKEVLNAFARNKYGIEYESESDKPNVRITVSTGKGLISIPLDKGDEYKSVKEIALNLSEILNLKKLEVAPVNFRSFDRKYEKEKRTIDFPGLYWLQFYDAGEFKKQGGKAILDNPYIEAQLIKDGIFIEVGKSPYDVHTPEGEALMNNANAAMPPVA